MEEKLNTAIGQWLTALDDKYCQSIESYTIQDIKDTARRFFNMGIAEVLMKCRGYMVIVEKDGSEELEHIDLSSVINFVLKNSRDDE